MTRKKWNMIEKKGYDFIIPKLKAAKFFRFTDHVPIILKHADD